MELVNKNDTIEYLKQSLSEWDSDKLIRYYADYKALPRFSTNVFDIPQCLKHDAFHIVSMEMIRRKIGTVTDIK